MRRGRLIFGGNILVVLLRRFSHANSLRDQSKTVWLQYVQVHQRREAMWTWNRQKKIELATFSAAPYTVSIGRGLLVNLVFLRKFDPQPSLLSSLPVKISISWNNEAPTSCLYAKFIDKALIGFKMPMNIADSEPRVFHYAKDLFERLENIGYGQFRSKDPKMTV